MHFQIFAGGRLKDPVLGIDGRAEERHNCRTAHLVFGRRQIHAEWTRDIGGIFAQSANDELCVRPRGIFDGSGKPDHPVGTFAQRLPVWPIHRDAVDEDQSKVAVFRRPLRRHIHRETFRKERFQGVVGDFEVDLEAGFGTMFQQRLRGRKNCGGREERESEDMHDSVSLSGIEGNTGTSRSRTIGLHGTGADIYFDD